MGQKKSIVRLACPIGIVFCNKITIAATAIERHSGVLRDGARAIIRVARWPTARRPFKDVCTTISRAAIEGSRGHAKVIINNAGAWAYHTFY